MDKIETDIIVPMFIIGALVSSLIWCICIYDWHGHWECVEFKHTSVTEGYCTLQKYVTLNDQINKELNK